MTTSLEPAKAVLCSHIAEIAVLKEAISQLSAEDVYQARDEAYAWLYATPRYHYLLSKPKTFPTPDYYRQPAPPLYDQWRASKKEIFYRGNIIPRPRDCSLLEYLQELSVMITDKNEKRTVWEKSLRCFAQWLREDMSLELQGGLDIIFPKKMTIQRIYTFDQTDQGVEKVEHGQIRRERDAEEYPVDIWIASDILKNLTKMVVDGQRSQHSASQALGFAWLCHAVGSARLITQEQIVFNSSLTTLKPLDSSARYLFSPVYHISIQSLFGPIEVPISKNLNNFLRALPRDSEDQRIFTMPWSSLLRTFYIAVDMSMEARKLGEITFRTLMSQSHEWKGYRYRPNASH